MNYHLARGNFEFVSDTLKTVMKRLLGLTRYAVVIPALASILGALLLMAQGSFAMVLAVIDSLESQYGLKETIVEVLTAIDASAWHSTSGDWLWSL
ncbi:hypothetical protein EMGBS5_11030 [Clavibacter sp.]|nr:hypothetical protein EMGBS5_11030 [Clavibacter sp.]